LGVAEAGVVSQTTPALAAPVASSSDTVMATHSGRRSMQAFNFMLIPLFSTGHGLRPWPWHSQARDCECHRCAPGRVGHQPTLKPTPAVLSLSANAAPMRIDAREEIARL